MKHIHILKLVITSLLALGAFYNGNAQCFAISANNLTFPEAGGTQQTTIVDNCPPGTFTVYNSVGWVSTSVSGNKITVTVQSNTGEERSVAIAILYNGNTSGGFEVSQDGTPPPNPTNPTNPTNPGNPGNPGNPPGPTSCRVNGFSGSSFSIGGESKNYTLSYSNCPSQVYFNFTDGQGNPLPSWVIVSQPSLTSVTVRFLSNSSESPRSVVIVGSRPDGQSGGIGGTFSQNCNLKVWYTDSDGDGFRDPNSLPEEDCANRGVGWTRNTTMDRCPDIYEPSNDCGPRIITGDNYVYARIYQEERSTTVDPQFFTQNDILTQTITYYDGLGRPMQKVGIGHTPSKGDVVTHIGYDGFGRVEKEWLPYADPDAQAAIGSFRSDAETGTDTYYSDNYPDDILLASPNPYSQKTFEASPLNRVLQQAAPGSDWAKGSGHEIEFGYRAHSATDSVRLFTVGTSLVNNTYVPILELDTDPVTSRKEFYSFNELYRTITYDENHSSGKNHSTEEFTDKQGRIVLKRTYADVPAMDRNGDGDTTDPGEEARSEEPHDTYYVYDHFGNLSYVLPPKMEGSTATLSEINGAMAELGYQYIYDHRNRLVEKQLPGKGREYIVYNALDQPIMTQDANQRAVNNPNLTTDEWLFTKYDIFGRVAYTGKAADGRARSAIQDDADAVVDDPNQKLWVEQGSFTNGGINIGYTNTAYPTTSLTEVFTVNYYDNYGFDRANEPALPTRVFGESFDNRTQNLATGSKVRVLDVSPSQWITAVIRYDDQARPIYTYTRNGYLGTVDVVTSKLDFVGRPQKVRSAHTRNGVTTVTLDNYDYDYMGRLLSQTQCIGDAMLEESCVSSHGNTPLVFNSPVTSSRTDIVSSSITLRPGFHVVAAPGLSYTAKIDPHFAQELIVYNNYDGLGQLVRKKVGGSPGATYDATMGLQTVEYAYNVRGWLTDINDVGNTAKLFNFRIGYNQGTNPLYNGNIGQTQWRTANNDDSSLKSYDYTYDALNRITAATDNTGSFNVSNISYDKNGNIQTLNRKGHIVALPVLGTNGHFGDMDILDYDYGNGNKLTKVSDTGNTAHGFKDGTNTNDDYEYDQNGNMTSDANKGITGINYNHLNLPTQINVNTDNIQYIYDATGVKMRKTVSTGNTTDYAGNYVYENGTLQFFGHPEGYVEPDGSGGYDYVYQYRDHLGNIRLSYQDTDNDGSVDSSEILQERNYYPFGLQHKGYNSNINGVENNYMTFQGKEEEKELGRNTYDFGWRDFDPAIARWTVVDPLAERRYELTPYNFVQNSPMFRIDPDGLTDFTLNRKTGEVTQVGEVNDEPDRILRTNRKGEIKYNRKGEAKVAIGDIEQGILSDGQNLKTGGNAIEVGGEGQPTEQGVESFALKLSEYVGTEIGGAYFSKNGGESTTHITIGGYGGNSFKKTTSHGVASFRQFSSSVEEFTSSLTGFFHTHPSGGGISDSDRLVPSGQDRRTRDNALKINPALKFFILTNPNYGGEFPRKIPYHTGYPTSERK